MDLLLRLKESSRGLPNLSKGAAITSILRTDESSCVEPVRFSHLLGKGLKSVQGEGPLPTAAIPEATEVAEAFAPEVDGTPGSLISETLFGIPTTAHILGGACMGSTPGDGVIDHRHRLFGYPQILVVDGSAVSANPGVNPSLTIAALAERAMSFFPPKSDPAARDC